MARTRRNGRLYFCCAPLAPRGLICHPQRPHELLALRGRHGHADTHHSSSVSYAWRPTVYVRQWGCIRLLRPARQTTHTSQPLVGAHWLGWCALMCGPKCVRCWLGQHHRSILWIPKLETGLPESCMQDPLPRTPAECSSRRLALLDVHTNHVRTANSQQDYGVSGESGAQSLAAEGGRGRRRGGGKSCGAKSSRARKEKEYEHPRRP